MDSGACARSMVCMPESMERTAAISAAFRAAPTFGPALLFIRFTALRLFAFVLLFFRVFLCMVLLQQSCDRLQEFVYLDRLVQNRYVVLLRVICRLGRGIPGQQNSR